MDTILTRTLQDHIDQRKNELFRQIMGLRVDESMTQQLRGKHEELKLLERRIKENFANPEGGSQ